VKLCHRGEDTPRGMQKNAINLRRAAQSK